MARTLGLLPQNPVSPEGVTVVDLVGRGRAPHQGRFQRWSAADEAAVAHALEVTDTLSLADRVVDELSGGQRQRVWIAMALAQETDVLLLDEPTTYLDVAHQVEVLDLLVDLNATRGTTVVMVLHELNLAARYADHLVAMRHGRVVAEGPPAQVLTEDAVAGDLRHAVPRRRRPRVGHPDGRPGRAARADRPAAPGRARRHTPPHPARRLPVSAQTDETTTTEAPPGLLTRVTVARVRRLSPSFVRVWLASPALADLARDQGFDTRFKIVFPGPTGELPPDAASAAEWQAGWMAMPDDVRPPMRTYTIRDVVGSGAQTQLVVDLVVHESDDPTTLGPACRWALAAAPGDTVVILAPHRAGAPWGGTEFDPGVLRDLLLIGDETALPAITRILADVGPGRTGHVFVEVPTREDVLELDVPPGFDLTWLTRDGRSYNRQLVAAVRSHLGLPASDLCAPVPEVPSDLEVEVWETPRYSSAGEDVAEQLAASRPGRDLDGTYAWIAGESWCVKLLRRALVTELDVDRGRVAFMGYWREGVSMRS